MPVSPFYSYLQFSWEWTPLSSSDLRLPFFVFFHCFVLKCLSPSTCGLILFCKSLDSWGNWTLNSWMNVRTVGPVLVWKGIRAQFILSWEGRRAEHSGSCVGLEGELTLKCLAAGCAEGGSQLYLEWCFWKGGSRYKGVRLTFVWYLIWGNRLEKGGVC